MNAQIDLRPDTCFVCRICGDLAVHELLRFPRDGAGRAVDDQVRCPRCGANATLKGNGGTWTPFGLVLAR